MDSRGLFALPPGTDFPRALVAGLIERMEGAPPEAMARVHLYLNTGRMLRAVRAAFDETGTRLLPRMRLITDLGADPVPGLPPAVPPLRRRLELAQLVAGLTHSLPDFAPGTGLYALADSLATLLAEMQGEGIAPEALERLSIADTHSEHWGRSLAFLRIVARYFDPDSPPDPEARQRRVIAALAVRWAENPPDHPVIVAGSTGSRGATALLLKAVAQLPQGAVVLPGFDFAQPAEAWDNLIAGPVPAEDHPQYRFALLMRALGQPPAQVRPWHSTPAPVPARNALVSLALRPAPVTDQWMTEGARLADLPAATEGMTLIEAPDPRSEALAIALILRQAAETGARAALITPDRLLTRRVSAALGRWGILPDDSAGQPLPLSPPGRFLRHVAAVMGRKLTLEALFVLLKHPLTATGAGNRGPHLRFTRDLELHLRRHGPAFPDAAALRRWAGAEADRLAWADWLGGTIAGLDMITEAPLATCIDRHLALAETLAAGPGGHIETSELWRKEGGQEAARIMADLAREAGHGGVYTPADYADLLAGLLQGGTVRQGAAAHSGIMIHGTLEARVAGVDLAILAGLNEGAWPQTTAPDPWLSRRMRQEAGLLLPERQIGLSAHDFQQAIAAPRAVLTRARRDAEAECVPSRWLNRLVNLMAGLPAAGGPAALEGMRARGRHWLDLAASLEAHQVASLPAEAHVPVARPAPRPPVAARMRELPVTAIKTLIRDPYAVYAGRILRLRPLNPLRPKPDPRIRGEVLHKIVEDFVKTRPEIETPETAQARLMQVTGSVLARLVPWPTARRLWLARIARIAPAFGAAEAARAAEGAPVVIEKKGAVPLRALGFTLTARPDRIDLLADGRVHIFDYKTGKPPSEREMKAFDKQLYLEAAMAERGGFEAFGPRAVAAMSHIQLGGEGATSHHDAAPDVIAETWAGLEKLIAHYLRADTGFTARRALQRTEEASDYDHLSRFGEWEMTDTPNPEDV